MMGARDNRSDRAAVQDYSPIRMPTKKEAAFSDQHTNQ